ncbi:ChaN family lipoprotein [Campylobacter mucosalis]|uniref:ChaN family lipoprotein n=1 Tax=Campylobacter mucosalis TaxID=202 RepID=UPI00146FFE0F|nr:ChaN family lipoprotein [Campylobacter mucosalis]
MYKNIVFLFVGLILTGCVTSFDISKNDTHNIKNIGKIIDIKQNKQISFDELIKHINKAEILLLGEEHNNFNHAVARVAILENFITTQTNVVLEMIDVSKQDLINKTPKTMPNDSLKNAINWDSKWDYRYYKTLVELAFYNANLKAGNLSKAEITTIYNGAMPLKGEISTTSEVKELIKQAILLHHNMDSELADKLVSIQQYKDRRMADILQVSQDRAVLVAGNLHIFKNIGVPLHLIDFKNKKSVIVVALDNSDEIYLNNNLADFVWVLK